MKLRLTGKLASWFFLIGCWFLTVPASANFIPSNSAEELVYTSLQSYYPEAKVYYPKQLSQLYNQLGFTYLWLDKNKQLNAPALLLKQDIQPWLYLADNPRYKQHEQILHLLNQLPNIELPRQRLAADLLLTSLFLNYQNDFLTRFWPKQDTDEDHGIVNKYETWDNWPNPTPESSLEEVFSNWLTNLKSSATEEWLTNLVLASRPLENMYLPLQEAFANFAALSQYSWPEINQNMHLGTTNSEITSLALQLYYHQDLASYEAYLPSSSSTLVFDTQLKAALTEFQLRHGLPPTGTSNAATRKWLNLPPKQRLKILAANIKRLHHLPKQRHSRYLELNLASQKLDYIYNNQLQLSMKAIIGAPGQRTPIMNQWLTSLVLNPVWNVPSSLAKNRILPRALANPKYLAQNNYELVDGWHSPNKIAQLTSANAKTFGEQGNNLRLVQKSGANNQLGKVKFRLSNQQAIYLHDTPYKAAFNNQQRNLSSGCVRLEKAELLANKLIETSNLSQQELDQIYALGAEKYLQIRPRVAVYLMYWTAFINEQGKLEWREDIYNKDQLEVTTQLAEN